MEEFTSSSLFDEDEEDDDEYDKSIKKRTIKNKRYGVSFDSEDFSLIRILESIQKNIN